MTLAQDALEAVAVAARLTVALEGELVDRLITERLDELAARLPPGPRLRKLLVHGPVGATLLRAAREHAADLVVIPMRREHERAHIADHHSDGYILRHSDVPVLVVPVSPDPSGGRA